MKLVAIGDIHGRDIWKQIVETEQPNTVVFVGDYFDSFDIPGKVQIDNFKNIIQWKHDNPQCKVVLLIGKPQSQSAHLWQSMYTLGECIFVSC